MSAEASARLPLVSIGIPTFNRRSSLMRAVQSALAQDYPNLEIIISDNQSDDGTEQYCRDVQAADPRVRFIRQPVNLGPERNFGAVLNAARGEYFMWLADDDWIDTNYVAECAKFLSANDDFVLAAGTVQYSAEGDNTSYAAGARAILNSPKPAKRVLEYYKSVVDNSAFYGVTRRECLAKLPILRTMGSDWFMMASLAAWGRIEILSDSKLHRSAGGVSRDTASMIRYYGLTGWAARQPFSPVAIRAAEDILWKSPAHRQVFSPLTRVLLSARVYATIIGRYADLSRSPYVLSNLWAIIHRFGFAVIRASAPLRAGRKSASTAA